MFIGFAIVFCIFVTQITQKMKFITYLENQTEQVGLIVNQQYYCLSRINNQLPKTVINILADWDACFPILRQIEREICNGFYKEFILKSPQLLAPIPHPPSFRDAYAFRQHVETSRRNRGLDMIEEFDQFPVFYFSNHQAIQGEGTIYVMPEHLNQLDFELEIAIVIKKEGINIKANQADEYIGGFMILNDFSARALQMQEMKLNLGPAKGKDFATAMGPFLLTPDELKPYLIKPKDGHIGNCYDLKMTCKINDNQVSEGNLKDMHWTFAELIERISYGVKLYPGDIIGSGTVGTGCLLEINGTNKRKDPNYQPKWLKIDDKIDLEIDQLGKLSNLIANFY